VVTDAGAPGSLLARPLAARSTILSLLLGRTPPRARPALLVRWCELFGVSETAARAALSRMTARGELVVRDGGYELAGRVAARAGEQERSLAPPRLPFDGRWRLAVLSTPRRSAVERARFRAACDRLHLVELRDGLWGRPDTLDLEAFGDDFATVDAAVAWWTAVPAPAAAERAIERFGVAARRQQGETLARALGVFVDAEAVRPALADAFVAGAAALQYVRRDPVLPAEIVGADWPADRLRELYPAYRAALSLALADWYQAGG
jgi:phenylacetic acid degradation operon negative regulatory protein